jgi:hypothetical protein
LPIYHLNWLLPFIASNFVLCKSHITSVRRFLFLPGFKQSMIQLSADPIFHIFRLIMEIRISVLAVVSLLILQGLHLSDHFTSVLPSLSGYRSPHAFVIFNLLFGFCDNIRTEFTNSLCL